MSGINPTLQLNFAKTKRLDPRITFSRADTGASQATYFGADGVLKYAGIGEPRFDHDPVTGESLGLLIEEQRANLLVRSEEFDNAAWTINSSEVTAQGNVVVAPDGTLTGYKLIATTGSAPHILRQFASVTSGTTYTQTWYVKKAEYTTCSVVASTGFSLQVADINLNTGAVTSSTFVTTPIVQSVCNDWWRIIVSAAATASTGNGRFQIYNKLTR
jgi:hypothetical protein